MGHFQLHFERLYFRIEFALLLLVRIACKEQIASPITYMYIYICIYIYISKYVLYIYIQIRTIYTHTNTYYWSLIKVYYWSLLSKRLTCSSLLIYIKYATDIYKILTCSSTRCKRLIYIKYVLLQFTQRVLLEFTQLGTDQAYRADCRR